MVVKTMGYQMKKLFAVVGMLLCVALCACSYLGLTAEPELDSDVILVEEAERMAQPVDPDSPGSLLSFRYRFGENEAMYDEYEITTQDDEVYFSANLADGTEAQGNVAGSVLEDIVALMNYNDIFEWNGFHGERETGGGYFEITAQFHNGKFDASGYEEKPENYRQGHAALKYYMEKTLAEVREQALEEDGAAA
ncbi:MAG TPA: hypothetical protein DEB31_04715 [Clostridiales bacterium]|nr:hypothetical protein [Clostridiales bacterium]